MLQLPTADAITHYFLIPQFTILLHIFYDKPYMHFKREKLIISTISDLRTRTIYSIGTNVGDFSLPIYTRLKLKEGHITRIVCIHLCDRNFLEEIKCTDINGKAKEMQ